MLAAQTAGLGRASDRDASPKRGFHSLIGVIHRIHAGGELSRTITVECSLLSIEDRSGTNVLTPIAVASQQLTAQTVPG
jgi:hypothetical protein